MTRTKTRNGLIAALDIGTSKVCCFIARAQEDGALKVVGVGHQVSRGIRNGTVVDMDAAETSVRAAVDAAEEQAQERIRDVVVNLSGGQPVSQRVSVESALNGHPISDADIMRLLHHGRTHSMAPDRSLIHTIPTGFVVDGADGIRDPRGMFGSKVAVELHLVSAALGPVRNLTTVVQRCHLDIEARVVSAYASGLATLVDDERELGVTCIDMGGGTTSIAVFLHNDLVHFDVVPVGGHHVTNDIARGLSTPLVHAERMKTLYGSAIPSPTDDREVLQVPLVGEDDNGQVNQVPRSMLVQIIQPRLEETFELVRNHLEASGYDKLAGRRVVLTGGASQLQGVRELASLILDKQVRPGRPVGLMGLAEANCGPAFSTCAGLLRFAAETEAEASERSVRHSEAVATTFGRIGQWLRKNF